METQEVKITNIDPTVLGLWGFSFATLLSNISALGFFPESNLILGAAIFLGGVIQVITGMLCYKNRDLFGVVTFVCFGFFWIANGVDYLFVHFGWTPAASSLASGWYSFCWTLFVLMLFLASLKKSVFLAITLFFVDMLLFFNMLGAWMESPLMSNIGAVCGVICASMAIYLAFAQFFLALNGKSYIPLK
ncbi:MAG: acetate uptake transporter [Marinifilaceae bacterium]